MWCCWQPQASKQTGLTGVCCVCCRTEGMCRLSAFPFRRGSNRAPGTCTTAAAVLPFSPAPQAYSCCPCCTPTSCWCATHTAQQGTWTDYGHNRQPPRSSSSSSLPVVGPVVEGHRVPRLRPAGRHLRCTAMWRCTATWRPQVLARVMCAWKRRKRRGRPLRNAALVRQHRSTARLGVPNTAGRKTAGRWWWHVVRHRTVGCRRAAVHQYRYIRGEGALAEGPAGQEWWRRSGGRKKRKSA